MTITMTDEMALENLLFLLARRPPAWYTEVSSGVTSWCFGNNPVALVGGGLFLFFFGFLSGFLIHFFDSLPNYFCFCDSKNFVAIVRI